MPLLQQTPPRVCSIVLAGKEEYPCIERWLGYRKPKPFCTFVGSRSMLQHTWDRADQLSHPNCKITIVGNPYLHETCSQLGGRAPGIILTEPQHEGLMVSLFLALTYLQVKAPDSMIVALPSDHFIYPEGQFLKTIQRAVWAAERLTDHVILLGATPPNSNPLVADIQLLRQLGWVFTSPIYAARAIKPSVIRYEDEEIKREDNLLQACVIVSKADVLWNLGWEHQPSVMALFENFREAIGTSHEKVKLKTLFHELKQHPSAFNAFLQRSERLAIIELEGVTWSDWETPEQIMENLASIGKNPVFPLESPTF